jgi:F420 biosynthesis protein FbiB-like protein
MNLLDTFRTLALSRRSLRAYQNRPIEIGLLHDLLTIATWAPSAHNRQPWCFVIIQTPAIKENLARQMGEKLKTDLSADGVPENIILQDTTRSYQRIINAPVAICLCISMQPMDTYADEYRQQQEWVMAIQSAAMAGQNLLLAAHAAGLGACWMCAPLFCPQIVREVLDLPLDWQPQALITLGYPDQHREKTRDALEKKTLWR